MHVFVRRSDLAAPNQDAVPIVGYYNDETEVPADAHGADVTMFSVPDWAIVNNYPSEYNMVPPGSRPIGPTLPKNWRETYRASIVGEEAARRILEVFPEYSQRNSVSELNGYILQFGTNVTEWPNRARNRKAEIDRCWNYVNAVRTRHGALANTTLPSDPTADSVWPSRIAPYQPL